MTYNKYEGKYHISSPIIPPYRNRKEDWYVAKFYEIGSVTTTKTEFLKLKNRFTLKEIEYVAKAYGTR